MPSPGPEALYIHIPFCLSRCRYCDFLSTVYESGTADRYLSALEAEARALQTSGIGFDDIRTIYIGGGTPTVLEPRQLKRLLGFIEGLVPASGIEEFTVEANPETVSGDCLSLLVGGGVTRVSLGIQAASDRFLNWLGRVHTVARAGTAAAAIAGIGLDLSVDLMYGLPGQGVGDWRETLQWAIDLGAGHLSAYALTIESDTPLGRAVAAGVDLSPDENLLENLYLAAGRVLERAGFVHYEVSNYALPGKQCLHNLTYWNYRPYLGLGAGAHSRLQEKGRVAARENPGLDSYLRTLEELVPRDPAGTRVLAPAEAAKEAVMMGLRTAEGIDPDKFEKPFSTALKNLRGSDFWRDLIDQGLAQDTPHLALTPAGWWVGDEIAVEVFGRVEKPS